MRILSTLLVSAFLIGTPTISYAQSQEAGGQAENSAVTSDNTETYQQLDLFGDVFERVKAQYVEEKTDKEIIENALNGMLMALDPHSSYLNDESFEDMQVNTSGEFGGLGIEVTMDNGLVKVVSPIDDTPAFRAGVQSGDYIVQIDEEPVMGLSLGEAVDKMRGKVGTEIHLLISREGEDAPIEMTLVRDKIKIRSVRSRVEGNTGYIRITTFNRNSDAGVKKAIAEIKKELGNKLNGYVLDLRNNPGGLLDQAISVSDIFLDKGEIVSTRGRHEEDTRRDNATEGDFADGLPIVVLINGGSASASEIVAGALQDHRRGILLGTKSFGKGSVQTVIPIPGHGAMRLTTARYYTPSGRSIQATGIEPDILVEPAKIETLVVKRLREANLKGALDKGKNGKKETKAANDNKDLENKAGEILGDTKGQTNASEKDKQEENVDYQLLRALDLLNGLNLYNRSDAMSGGTPKAASNATEEKSAQQPAQ